VSPALAYALTGLALFALALFGFFIRRHIVRRIIALNILGSGAFLVFLGMAARGGAPADPVPQALVITGIVVAVATTALALAVLVRLHRETGRLTLDSPGEDVDRGLDPG
jgi:multicomponent Na+:H+ antiporter subunit C